jgi:hypothetical protein
MSIILGIDFGYATEAESLGYIKFKTEVKDGVTTIALESKAEVSTLVAFKETVLKTQADSVSLIAIDAPITPKKIATKPDSGRQVEMRFSRGGFNNSKRGPQPSSISVPKQGWPLYCGAMELLNELTKLGFPMPAITVEGEKSFLSLNQKACVEVCPKMTQALLTTKSRIKSRPNNQHKPAFYRQIDNWLFPHLFVTDHPEPLNPANGTQPAWGADRQAMCELLGKKVCIDKSVWDEANRISASNPLGMRHEFIGAFVSGFQGALALAGVAIAVGVAGDHEGYYILPSSWHNDWCGEWTDTARDGDSVRKFQIQLPKKEDDESKVGGK